MKKLALLFLILSTSVFADIPVGHYELDKIMCSNGEALKLGGKFMSYTIALDVTEIDMKMTAVAKSASWSPFKLFCTQINVGKFSYIEDNKYEGYLALNSVKCNAKIWEGRLRKHAFGIEEQGVFTYTVVGNKLTIQNPETVTKYSCKKTGSFPIYHYTLK
ncbi:hypothetical protein A9Q84_01875 [Halobacteriovorax marinus]|uniref:Uncharacterized protein n=1 Tax=Halobacteriovorax marinus TaxID=97084 RepID=A0A1Y5FC67_9BACT|nr:hypothetical protein A9Q84_01875 [Halobacteriovorax marinus]